MPSTQRARLPRDRSGPQPPCPARRCRRRARHLQRVRPWGWMAYVVRPPTRPDNRQAALAEPDAFGR
jgi:hypothetical protein